MSQRLGDLLVKEKVITPEQLDQALKVQKESGTRLGSILVKLGFLSDEDVTNFLSRQYGVPAINLTFFEIDGTVVKLIPYETAKRYQILPLSRVGSSLTIAMRNIIWKRQGRLSKPASRPLLTSLSVIAPAKAAPFWRWRVRKKRLLALSAHPRAARRSTISEIRSKP